MLSNWDNISLNLLTGSYKIVLPEESNLAGNLGALPRKKKFLWDSGNIRHIFNHHPERELTIEEVESVFHDKNAIHRPDKLNDYNEMEYICIGMSQSNIVRFVVYSVRNGMIRPGSARTANADADDERKAYYDSLKKK